jgi:hypothetical protein
MFMQETYDFSKNASPGCTCIAANAPSRGCRAGKGTRASSRDSQYTYANLSSAQDDSWEKLRSALSELLYAVSRVFQDKPEEAYGFVLHAAELPRIEPADVIDPTSLTIPLQCHRRRAGVLQHG